MRSMAPEVTQLISMSQPYILTSLMKIYQLIHEMWYTQETFMHQFQNPQMHNEWCFKIPQYLWCVDINNAWLMFNVPVNHI